jgi:hypothetical protein
MSKQCGILNISQPCRPQRPVTGTALLFTLHISGPNVFEEVSNEQSCAGCKWKRSPVCTDRPPRESCCWVSAASRKLDDWFRAGTWWWPGLLLGPYVSAGDQARPCIWRTIKDKRRSVSTFRSLILTQSYLIQFRFTSKRSGNLQTFSSGKFHWLQVILRLLWKVKSNLHQIHTRTHARTHARAFCAVRVLLSNKQNLHWRIMLSGI